MCVVLQTWLITSSHWFFCVLFYSFSVVCCGDILQEAHAHGNSKYVNVGVMLGFTLMMILDVALGWSCEIKF